MGLGHYQSQEWMNIESIRDDYNPLWLLWKLAVVEMNRAWIWSEGFMLSLLLLLVEIVVTSEKVSSRGNLYGWPATLANQPSNQPNQCRQWGAITLEVMHGGWIGCEYHILFLAALVDVCPNLQIPNVVIIFPKHQQVPLSISIFPQWKPLRQGFVTFSSHLRGMIVSSNTR